MSINDSDQIERQVLQDVNRNIFNGYVMEQEYPLIKHFKRLRDGGYINAVDASSRAGLQFLEPELTQRGVERLRYLT